MILDRSKLYTILLITCAAGYVWLYFTITNSFTDNKPVEVCLIKHATNMPCPSCGATRSVISLTQGDFGGAFYFNPLGYLIATVMIIVPIWILIDAIGRTDTLFNFYSKIESYLKRPKIAIPLIILVIINWIWNITKGL